MSLKRQLQPSTGRWVRGRPSVWAMLIAANVGCFVTQIILSHVQPEFVESWLALSREGIRSGRIWQLVSYMFVHGDPSNPEALNIGIIHLATNMFALFFAAREIEAILGSRHLFGIYFGGGILGGLAQMGYADTPTVGASAGVCAVLLAFTTALPEIQLRVLLLFIIPIKMKAKQFAALLVGITSLCIALKWLPSVAHVAHLGGSIFGWLYVKRLGYGNPLPFQIYFAEKKRREQRLARLSSEQFLVEEMDPILEKIAREGMRSLNRRERKLLEMGRRKMVEKPGRVV